MNYTSRAILYNTWNQCAILPAMFFISNIILHRFHADNNESESGIGYGIIIGRDLMAQLGL